MALDKEKTEYKVVDKGDGSWQIVAYRWIVDPIAIFTDVNRAQEYIELIEGSKESRTPESDTESQLDETRVRESETTEAIEDIRPGEIGETMVELLPATPVSSKKSRKSFAVEIRHTWTPEEDLVLQKYKHIIPRPFAKILKELPPGSVRSEKAIKSRYARLSAIEAKSKEAKSIVIGEPKTTPVAEVPSLVALDAEEAPKEPTKLEHTKLEPTKLEPKSEEPKAQSQVRVVSAAISSPMALARQPQQLAKTGPESGIEFGSFRPSDDLIKAGR